MNKATKSLGPKQRIIETALNLFYNQGYLATGINQIIDEAGVSKASFYDHFKSKEDLCVSYLQARGSLWGGMLKEKIEEYKKPRDRFLAPLAYFDEWLPQCKFRGCAFLNIASEITDTHSSMRKEVVYTKDGLKSIIRELTKDLKDSDAKYKGLDIEFVVNAYFVLMEGAISASQIYGDLGPIETARRSILKIVCKET